MKSHKAYEIDMFKPYHLEQVEPKKVIKFKRSHLVGAFIIFCMATPFSNWMLLFSNKIKDVNIVREW